MHQHVQAASDDSRGRRQRRAEHDVGQLADGRIGQPGLEVVLGQRDERGRDDREAGDVHQPHAGAAARQQVDPEDVDDDLEHREHAGLDHGNRVQQRADRRRRDHRRRQPAMERHQRRLARAEGEQREQDDELAAVDRSGEDPARREFQRAGPPPRPGQAEQEHPDRRGQQDTEVNAPRSSRLFRAVVRHERVRREREDLVEQEQRQQVARQSDAHRGGDGDRETDVEPRLRTLVAPAHVADRVERGDDPQERGDQREQQSQRLQRQRQRQAGEHVDQLDLDRAAAEAPSEVRDVGEQQQARDQRGGLAKVGPAVQQGHDQRAAGGDGERQHQRGLRVHGTIPSSASAARCATPALPLVQNPNTIEAPIRIQVGTSIDSGASPREAPSAAGLK